MRVPHDQVGRLVGDDGQQVPILVPAEAGAHPGQGHLERPVENSDVSQKLIFQI